MSICKSAVLLNIMDVMKKQLSLRGAWLVTWEFCGDHARVPDDERVVAVLNYRWSGKRVREFVEQLHSSLTYSSIEKLRVAKDSRANPCPADFAEANGSPWLAEALCGTNPWLRARKVKNLRAAEEGEISTAGLVWEESIRPSR